MGWSLHEDGTVFGPELLQFNILRDSTKKIRLRIMAMWEHHVVDTMTRKGVGDYYVDFKLAVKLLSTMEDSDQHLLKLNVVGGFQTQQQKALWDENVISVCLLCGEPDTREHRLLSCKDTLHVRAQHAEACRILSEYRPEWCYMPLPRMFDEITILRAFVATIKIPPLDQAAYSGQSRLRFFYRWWCNSPLTPCWAFGSMGSYSRLINDRRWKEVLCWLLYFLNLHSFHSSGSQLWVWYAGDQTVARGELQAIVAACKIALSTSGWQDVDFFTDASYVCTIVAMVESGLFSFCLHKLPNADLILELDELWQRDIFHVHKVKSHRPFDDATDLDDLWRIAGNFCADMVVGLAFKTIPSCIKDCADRAVAFQAREKSCLHCVFWIYDSSQQDSLWIAQSVFTFWQRTHDQTSDTEAWTGACNWKIWFTGIWTGCDEVAMSFWTWGIWRVGTGPVWLIYFSDGFARSQYWHCHQTLGWITSVANWFATERLTGLGNLLVFRDAFSHQSGWSRLPLPNLLDITVTKRQCYHRRNGLEHYKPCAFGMQFKTFAPF